MKKENNKEKNMDERLEVIETKIKKLYKLFKIFFVVFILSLIGVIIYEIYSILDFIPVFNANTAIVYCNKSNQNNIYKIKYNKENKIVSFSDNNTTSVYNNLYMFGEKVEINDDVNKLISDITSVYERNGQSCSIEYYDKKQNKIITK